jgi:hypothetical protein
VNYSDGFFTNNTDFTQINPQLTPPLTQSNVVKLYAAKHNPFVYFKNVQQGTDVSNSLATLLALVVSVVCGETWRQDRYRILHSLHPINATISMAAATPAPSAILILRQTGPRVV